LHEKDEPDTVPSMFMPRFHFDVAELPQIGLYPPLIEMRRGCGQAAFDGRAVLSFDPRGRLHV
jgi:hypothetical protein